MSVWRKLSILGAMGLLLVVATATINNGGSGGTASSMGFDGITSATNTTAAMVVGTGGSMTVSGSGTINATSLGGTAAASYAPLASPSFTTPTLGAATATTVNKYTLTQPASAATLTILNNKTFAVNNSLTLAGTDSTTMTFPATSDTVAGLGTAQSFTAQQYFPGNTFFVASSDFSTAANTNLQTITGLTFTLPANTALNVPFYCALSYFQATAAVADQFGIQSATISPTNIHAVGMMQTGASTYQSNNADVTNTTATTVVSGTPSAITTVWNAWISGMIENPSNVSTNVINIMVKTGTAADVVTVKRGSYCKIF